jgi:hypothetical protein
VSEILSARCGRTFSSLVVVAGACGGTGDASIDAGSADAVAARGVPTYPSFQLQARMNFSGNDGGSFNLPPDHFFGNEDVHLNDRGDVGFRLSVVPGGAHALWYGGNGTGDIVHTTEAGAFMSGVGIGADGVAVFALTDSSANGVYRYDPSGTPRVSLRTVEPLGASDWGTPMINRLGHLGFRASFGAGRATYGFDGVTARRVATETALDAASPYSFLFNPALNDSDQLASKVRLGPGLGNERPDEIQRWSSDGSIMVIARDLDADAASPYVSFDASKPSLNNRGQVAFIAEKVDGLRAVLLSDGATTTQIAVEGSDGVAEIEFFSPSCNDAGLVGFRALGSDGLSALWVGDGITLRRVVGEHDVIGSDLGDARVDQEIDGDPVFSGSPQMNANGDLAFSLGLTPPADDQVEWGTAVYVAPASYPN